MGHVCTGAFSPSLWIYTNFDCNLQCSYCCASSSPRAERRSLSMPQYTRLLEEAEAGGITEVFLTGGEPFLLPDVFDRLRLAADRFTTTILTNAMLFKGSRLEGLRALRGVPVRFQVSLDGPAPRAHDPVRGEGSWARAVEGIRTLIGLGFPVSISTTATAANAGLEAAMSRFVSCLGVDPADHFVRPLARRGHSAEGMEVSAATLEPEVTVSRDGVFWHPLACEDDLLVTRRLFPFAHALARTHDLYHEVLASGGLPQRFR